MDDMGLQDDTLTYLHADALSSASLVTRVTGTLVRQRRYLPYGATRWSSGALPTDRRCTGQREKVTLGLYDYGARVPGWVFIHRPSARHCAIIGSDVKRQAKRGNDGNHTRNL